MSVSSVSSVGSGQVQASKQLDPNVEQAMIDCETLSRDIQQLIALLESGKATPAQIAQLQNKIVSDSSQLQAFMAAHSSSFTSLELSVANGLSSEAGNLGMLPPQDTTDISYMAGVLQGYSMLLYAQLNPSNK